MDIIVEQILHVKPDVQEIVVRELRREIRKELREHATRWIERRLENEVERWLGRKHYQRRKRRSGRKLRVACLKCNSSYQRDFMRNGRRQRSLLTLYGQLSVWLPRVVCQCGGSVPIPFTLLRRWQRVWQDVRMQVQDWVKRRMSLREMQVDLGKLLDTSMGLRTLNEMVHATKRLQIGERQLSTVPPVVALDGIWMTQLTAKGVERTDKKGRKRLVKRKKRRAILV